ncbi:MAG: Hsp20/alpha crystallin family protein, partial [Tidjanibacter sp.]|nr:Hsp20/alpha crystallin family protein [Tidjanibacter sp.]
MSAIVRRNQGWVPSILGDLLGGEWLDSRATSGITPAINVKETKKNYLVEVAAPGLTKEDFD